jgi:uncharacterized membrane protein
MSRPAFHTVNRWLLALLFIAAGVNHFVRPDGYASIVPPWLPAPVGLVYVSGVAELVLGALVLTRWQRWAGWGLVALLVAVYPANVFMALDHAARGASPAFMALLWFRLPLQGVLVGWVLRTCVPDLARPTRAAPTAAAT